MDCLRQNLPRMYCKISDILIELLLFIIAEIVGMVGAPICAFLSIWIPIVIVSLTELSIGLYYLLVTILTGAELQDAKGLDMMFRDMIRRSELDLSWYAMIIGRCAGIIVLICFMSCWINGYLVSKWLFMEEPRKQKISSKKKE